MPFEFVARNGIVAQDNSQISGSLYVSASDNNTTALYTNGDLIVSGSLYATASYGSIAIKVQGDTQVTGSLYATGSIHTFSASFINLGGLVNIGDTTADIHRITGSLYVTASNDAIFFVQEFGINTAFPAYELDVSGSVRLTGSLAVGNVTPSATVGRIDAANDVVAFSTSDSRFKTNVIPIPDSLYKINQISGVEFDWIPNDKLHGYTGHDVGVIAQELERVLPEVVTTRDNGYKAVKYEKIVALLIEAIKELKREIDELKNRK